MLGAQSTLSLVRSPRLALHSCLNYTAFAFSRLVSRLLFPVLHIPCLVQPYPSLFTTPITDMSQMYLEMRPLLPLACSFLQLWFERALSKLSLAEIDTDPDASIGRPLVSCARQKGRTRARFKRICHTEHFMVQQLIAGLLMVCALRGSHSAPAQAVRALKQFFHELLPQGIYTALKQ